MISKFDALLYAYACEAAYELDATARAALLSAAKITELSYVQGKDDARALLCRDWTGRTILAFQGTQFSRGEILSILSNLEVAPTAWRGGRVETGYLDQVRDLAPQLAMLAQPDVITGHSLGGVMAEIYGEMIAITPQIVISFGAPKCADIAFWNTARVHPVRIVNERDAAPVWPPWEGYTQPGNMLWLHREDAAASLTEMRNRPVPADSVSDHMIETYIANLEALPS